MKKALFIQKSMLKMFGECIYELHLSAQWLKSFRNLVSVEGKGYFDVSLTHKKKLKRHILDCITL